MKKVLCLLLFATILAAGNSKTTGTAKPVAKKLDVSTQVYSNQSVIISLSPASPGYVYIAADEVWSYTYVYASIVSGATGERVWSGSFVLTPNTHPSIGMMVYVGEKHYTSCYFDEIEFF